MSFASICQAALSSDNNVRKKAEKAYMQMRSQPDKYLSSLGEVLIAPKAPLQARCFLAVMLRQDVGVKSPVWVKSSQQAKQYIQKILLQLLHREPQRVLRRHLCEVVGRLASHTVRDGKWSELLNALKTWCTSQEVPHIVAALHITGILSEYAANVLGNFLPQIHQVIRKSVESKNATLMISAVKTTTSLIIGLEGDAQRKFMQFVPALFKVITKLAEMENDDGLVECIDQIANLVGFRRDMFRPFIKDIIKLMAKTATYEILEGGTRRTALSLVVEFAKKDRTAVKEVKETGTQILPLAFKLLFKVNTHMDEWGKGTKEKDPDDEDFCMGWDTLDYLSTFLGPSLVLSSVFPLIERTIGSKNWIEKHAAISALTAMMAGCEKLLLPKLGNLISTIAPMAKDSKQHVRVRWAAINCLGRMCLIFKAQQKYGKTIGGCFVNAVDSRAHVRLAAHGALCLVNFCKGLEAEEMAPYAATLLKSLAKLLGVDAVHAQANALSAVSAIAASIEGDFAEYYQVFMPGVIRLLAESKGPHKRNLRAKAIECVGVIAAAVGKNAFHPQFKSVMNFLLQSQSKGFSADDPAHGAILQACARICQCMGSDFEPYIKIVVPPLLKAAADKRGAFMQDAEEDLTVDEDDGYEIVDFSVRGLGNKRMVLNTCLLQEKAVACNMLYQYATELKKGFFPYVKPTLDIMAPLMTYRYNEGVRIAAIDIIPPLLECMKDYGGHERAMLQIFEIALVPYLTALKIEGEPSSMVGILHSFSDAIDLLPRPMEAKQILSTHQILEFVLSESNNRRRNRMLEMKEADDELRDEIEEENGEEDEMIGYVGSVVKSMAAIAKEDYVRIFCSSALFKIFWEYLDPRASSAQNTAALLSFDEIIERGGPAAAKLADKFVPMACGHAFSTDTDVRQAAVWGIGMAALAMGTDFKRHADKALKCLIKVINSQDSRGEEFGESTEVAIRSVGTICRVMEKSAPNAVAQILPMWLSWLPVSRDEDDAQYVHKTLLYFLENPNSPIYGKGRANLQKVLSILAKISNTEYIDDKTQRDISQLVGKISNGLGPQRMLQLKSNLSPELREKLCQVSQ
mmetsp:Transcript_4208/g.6242  ORF Transcript_4208/g.6242 Transcript_4208/m.6242 type:complete len:1084 (+) Transcript_4208:42-3293(+)